jgi:multidrug efflux pump subunit AcrB
MSDFDGDKGLIAWFARNPVAANLLMVLIIALGLLSVYTIKKDIMPTIDSHMIQVMQVYPGAAPSEVEKGIVLKIEEAIKDVDGIKRIESRAYDSAANIRIEAQHGVDIDTLLNEVKIQIDSIATFPEEAERPVISKVDWMVHAVQLQLFGNINERSGKLLAEDMKQEMLALADVGRIEIHGVRDSEITIEIDESLLRKYGLTLGQVAKTIAAGSIDLPAGSIRADSGDILLRTRGQAYDQKQFEQVVLLSWPDGTRLTLGDIASINDGFVETEGFAVFDDAYTVALTAYAVGDQDIIKVADAVKGYMQRKAATLPEGVHLDYWADTTYYLDQRLSMMLRNLGLGAILVFITLGLFMELRIAFWVMLGLPICFLGALAMLPMPGIDVSINMMSLFGFILVLGIVVDDAIIIGESVHDSVRRHGHSLERVIKGAQRVAMPATFGVLTTIAAFAPTLFMQGPYANFLLSFGAVVTLCLLFSLVESKWILPAHLAHSGSGGWLHSRHQERLQQANNRALDRFITHYYRPFLEKTIAHRYNTVAVFLGVLILVFGLIAGGWIRYVMMTDQAGDYIQANLEMVRGTPDYKTREALLQMRAALSEIEAEYQQQHGEGEKFYQHIFSYGLDGRIGFFMIELVRPDVRKLEAKEVVQRWREKVGDIPGARVLSFTELEGPGDKDLKFNIVGKDREQLQLAASELEEKLRSYYGVFDIENGSADLVNEIHIDIKPGAEALGLSLFDVGRQVRDAFYGSEAQRLQRGNDEVKVMVRYPQQERRTVADLENMYIRTPDGSEVPLMSVAELEFKPAMAESIRVNRATAVPVSAEVNKAVLEPNKVVREITGPFFAEQVKKYPDLIYKLDGDALESKNIEDYMFKGFLLSLFAIYALLAIPLKSYIQPLMVMSVIPFGVIGAAIGHVIMGGMPLSMMSLMGVIALSGVVVNDSLILVEFVNRDVRDKGVAIQKAVVDAGCRRFRAILLTSLTTFLGILPMLLEGSAEAQFMVPMAVSLGFGIVFATVISLFFVPNLYVILEDIKALVAGPKSGDPSYRGGQA